MPFRNYTQLVEEIANWMARDDLATEIADAVWLTECEIQRTIQFDVAEKIFEGTAVAEQDYIELPDDFAEALAFRWTNISLGSVNVIGWDTFDRITKRKRTTADSDNMPVGGAIFGNRLYITPAPGAEAFTLFYKAGVQHLGADAEKQTNRLLREYPDVLLYGSLVQIAIFTRDADVKAECLPLYTNAREEARQQEWRRRTGHGPLAMVPDVEVY